MTSIIAVCLAATLSALSPLDPQAEQLEQDLSGYILADLEITGHPLIQRR
jgi:hypothetical protein